MTDGSFVGTPAMPPRTDVPRREEPLADTLPFERPATTAPALPPAPSAPEIGPTGRPMPQFPVPGPVVAGRGRL